MKLNDSLHYFANSCTDMLIWLTVVPRYGNTATMKATLCFLPSSELVTLIQSVTKIKTDAGSSTVTGCTDKMP
jgi:hypothetical protein